jgi:putative YhdH/YhfP family quinone oxidoreductase
MQPGKLWGTTRAEKVEVNVRCFVVEKADDGKIRRGVVEQNVNALPPGEVLIRVQYSSLNFKDALAAQGHPGVVKQLPHVPGIDAAGVVETSESEKFRPGDEVLVTGYELGAGRWGGWSDYIRVPADWPVPLPPGLSLVDAMTLGTAGFTAAQCVDSLQHHGVLPASGKVVVTGATGGVGTVAVMLLAKLGYEVIAISGKPEQHAWLRERGAQEVLGRDAVDDRSGKPLLATRWAGAIDTVGGNTLATLVRSLSHRGCVAACGLVGGTDVPLTVYPFLLRGVTLDGVDSASCPRGPREKMWRLLSGDWKLDDLAAIRTVVPLTAIEAQIEQILAGKIVGRVVVDVAR